MLFNNKETQESAQKELQAGISAPFVLVDTFCLNSDYASLCVTISLDAKDTWPHGYLENTRYARLHFHSNGTVEQFSGRGFKVRKFTGKSIQAIIDRLNSNVEKALKG